MKIYREQVLKYINSRLEKDEYKMCKALIDFLKDAKLLEDKDITEVELVVGYRLVEEDTPLRARHLIPRFHEFVNDIQRCGIKIKRMLEEYELNDHLYDLLVEPLKR
jgi:hypothetical protein